MKRTKLERWQIEEFVEHYHQNIELWMYIHKSVKKEKRSRSFRLRLSHGY